MEEYFWKVSKDHYAGKRLEDMFPENHYQVKNIKIKFKNKI